MFTYSTVIRLRDTDATGVIYFTEQMRLALEAFEAFLLQRGWPLKDLLSSPYLMPIVHAEADYLSALCVDDPVNVKLRIAKVGARSFSVEYEIFTKERLAGKVQLVHAFIRKGEDKACEIPQEFREKLYCDAK